jgi:hypothetical protein
MFACCLGDSFRSKAADNESPLSRLIGGGTFIVFSATKGPEGG